MWVTLFRSAFALGILGFLMWALTHVLSPLTNTATSGPNADHETVTQIATLFNMMTLDNLTLLAAVAVGLFLIYRATLESRLGG